MRRLQDMTPKHDELEELLKNLVNDTAKRIMGYLPDEYADRSIAETATAIEKWAKEKYQK